MTGPPPAREPDYPPIRYLEGLLWTAQEPHRRHLDGVMSSLDR